MAQLLFVIHFAATWYLVGLCWLVQRVQYPLMDRVGEGNFVAYEGGHVSRIGLIVAPMMLIELASGTLLLIFGGDLTRRPLFIAGMLLLSVIWLSTFFIQVPLHNTLAAGFDAESHAALVRTNWIRTLGWSARGMMLFWMLTEMLGFESA